MAVPEEKTNGSTEVNGSTSFNPGHSDLSHLLEEHIKELVTQQELNAKYEHLEYMLKLLKRPLWSFVELESFKFLYNKLPNCFEAIADFIPNKSSRDCIDLYELMKSQEEFSDFL